VMGIRAQSLVFTFPLEGTEQVGRRLQSTGLHAVVYIQFHPSDLCFPVPGEILPVIIPPFKVGFLHNPVDKVPKP